MPSRYVIQTCEYGLDLNAPEKKLWEELDDTRQKDYKLLWYPGVEMNDTDFEKVGE